MRLQLTAGLILLGCVQLVVADDQTKTAPNTKGRSSSVASTSSADAPKPPQAVVRRPVNPSFNPNLRPANPNVTATGNTRLSPTNLNRTIASSNTPRAVTVPNRTTVVKPNQRPNVVTKNAVRTNRNRLPGRSGSELSFTDAQAQCARHHHDRDWWRHHHTRFVFYGGGFWFWNAGWWFPAWGYSPYYNSYVYDGPIYGFGELQPGDVTAQVQEALAQQGYYHGPIDGVLGPETRDAILRFQADHGLATTAAIDEATLNTLGLT